MKGEGKTNKKKERRGRPEEEDEDGEYREGTEADVEDDEDEREKKVGTPMKGKGRRKRTGNNNTKAAEALEESEFDGPESPRARQLLDIVNSRDLARIKGLHGFGAKKAQDLVDCLALRGIGESGRVESLAQLRMLPGMGGRAVERAYEGLVVEA
jgi:hypothetical protein